MPNQFGLPSKREFENQTSARNTSTSQAKSVINSRGPKIRLIDLALSAVDGLSPSASNDDALAKLRVLAKACAYWLSIKKGKTSTMSGHRSQRIGDLLGETIAAIKNIDENEAYYAEKKCRAIKANLVIPSHIRKTGFRGKNLKEIGKFEPNPESHDRAPKGLDGTYQLEREVYVNTFKPQGVTGASVAAGAVHQGLSAGSSKTWDTLAFSDYLDIFDELKRSGGDTAASDASVSYFPRKDRIKYLVMIESGNCRTTGNMAYSTSNKVLSGGLCADMYAIDRYGNFYCKDSSSIGGMGYFNHSSFCAGMDVISAGTTIIMNGTMCYIDNASGHYKPSEDDLKAALAFLRGECGVDLSNNRLRVGLMTDGAVQCYDGGAFLDDRRVPWQDAWNAALVVSA